MLTTNIRTQLSSQQLILTNNMVKTKSKGDFVYAVGRRKNASARVRLFKGKGESTANGVSIDKYFPGPVNYDVWSRPFRVLDVSDRYYVSAKVVGGGKKGQVDAVAHAIAKALVKENAEFKKPLREAGLLTRDARVRERRKVATGGKARRKKQSPKR